MLELALRGGHRYWIWVFTLITLTGGSLAMFVLQMTEGLTVTAMSRDMPWGFYIAQLTFLVGVAASAVVVVLPYYLHDVREFGKLTIFGEFLAIPAVVVAMLFVFVDIGQPARVFNLFLYWSVDGAYAPVVPFMWLSFVLAVVSIILIVRRRTYGNPNRLVPLAVMIFVSIWIDKGAGMMTGGLNPSPLGRYIDYFPSWVEITMGLGLYAFGALILTVLYKIAITVKKEAGGGTSSQGVAG